MHMHFEIGCKTSNEPRAPICPNAGPTFPSVEMLTDNPIVPLLSIIEIKIVDIPPAEKELGYTSQGNTIHLANDHEIIKDLDFEHKLIFIKGIFAHELMHQLNTNFKAFEKKANSIAKFEREIYCEIQVRQSNL